MLAEDKDALGVSRATIQWHLSPMDLHSRRISTQLMGTELAQACGARFEPARWLDGGDLPLVRPAAHHMGTTRMSSSAADGVVDRDCTVHGIRNLHLAGSSVFSTGAGWAFPTYTVVALAFRLADHLQGLMTVAFA